MLVQVSGVYHELYIKTTRDFDAGDNVEVA